MSDEKMNPGDLYLYNMDPKIDKRGNYVDLPVIAIKKNKHLNTWLCLLPNRTLGGFFPSEMVNITLNK